MDSGTCAEPAGLAGSGASREGMGTLPGCPSTMTSPPSFRNPSSACFDISAAVRIVVNSAG
jgi:hypothetical protein